MNANANGVVSASVTIPANADIGLHTIEIRGTGVNGQSLTKSISFTVTQTLPRTGAMSSTALLWGLTLMALGAAAMWRGRPVKDS